jgi:hypothetical protein
MYIVGSIPELGSWKHTNAIRMEWTPNNNWVSELKVKYQESFEYKFLIGDEILFKVTWDQGKNK